MRADLRAQHDLGEIIGYAYRIYAANFSAMFLIALLAAPPEMLAVIARRRIESEAAESSVSLILQLLLLVVIAVVAGALMHATHDVTGGARADFGRSLDAALGRFDALLSTVLLSSALAAAALFAAPFLAVYWLVRRDATIDGRRDWWLALVPGALFLYLAVRWVLALPAVIIDGRRNWAALDASADLVRTRWWRTLGINLIIVVIALGPSLVASISTLAAPIVEAIVMSLASALVLPFVAAAQTLFYHDLKARIAVAVSAAAINDSEPDVPGKGA